MSIVHVHVHVHVMLFCTIRMCGVSVSVCVSRVGRYNTNRTIGLVHADVGQYPVQM